MRLTEVIQAFDAPILRGLGCHLRGREIAKIEGQREVQYGVLKDEAIYVSHLGHAEEKISIADRARVSKPSGYRLGPLNGTVFSRRKCQSGAGCSSQRQEITLENPVSVIRLSINIRLWFITNLSVKIFQFIGHRRG